MFGLPFFLRFYLFIERQQDRESGEKRRGGERERESQADSTLSTESDVGLGLGTLRS